MDNRRGSGIFLGIVSIATLIVAIIGATFAYFSAVVTGEGNVTAGAYEFKASMSIEKVYPDSDENQINKLIPFKPDFALSGNGIVDGVNNTNMLYALNTASSPCVDDNGYAVCIVYKVSFENYGAQDLELEGNIYTTENNSSEIPGREPFSNLSYQSVVMNEGKFVLSGTDGNARQLLPLAEDEISTCDEGVCTGSDGGEAVSITTPKVVISKSTTDDSGNLVPGEGAAYVVIFLNDALSDQSKEMGATYAGKIIFRSTSDSANGLTGTFNIASSPDPEPEPGSGSDT